MKGSNLYVLIHSPLVGPLTWSVVGDELRQRGLDVVIPTLRDSSASKEPFWKQHAESVAPTLDQIPRTTSLTLVAHSGAGPLLPVMQQSIHYPIHACVFVDAGIPRDGATRLDLMGSEDPEWAQQFRAQLARGERFPSWSEDDLLEVIPDEELRSQMISELRPRGFDYFAEPIPVFDGWPDAPCAYIQFSPAYKRPAAEARQAGWQTYMLEAGHFHMLVDAKAVTDLLIKAVTRQF